MAEERGEACEGGGLHFEVTDLHALVLERLDLLVLFRVGNIGTELATLRTVETSTGYGIAANHIILGYLVNQVSIGNGHIGSTLDGVPLHVLGEGTLHGNVANHVTSGIVVQKTIETDAFDRSDETACGCEGLQTTASADAYHGQRAMLVALGASSVVDVCQCVELIDHDIDVITADAMALAGDALAFVGAGDGMELAAADFVFYGVEVGCYGVYASGVAHKNNLVSQEFGLQVKMETGTVVVDDKL